MDLGCCCNSANNLKFWFKSQVVVSKTLDLIYELATGYSSAKLLIKLDTINMILRMHTVPLVFC